MLSQAEAKKHEGEKVTPESYAKWRAAFDAEMAAKAKKEEEDRLKALPPREREEAKRWAAKPTGQPGVPIPEPADSISSPGRARRVACAMPRAVGKRHSLREASNVNGC